MSWTTKLRSLFFLSFSSDRSQRYAWFGLVFLLTIGIYAIAAMAQYHRFPALGFDQYLQPGGMFAAPDNIARHGFTAARTPAQEATGWDGQFYYYLADDPLLLKDTLEHMDGAHYRSQRIGFALFVKGLSLAFGQEWVSPVFYFGVSVLLMSFASGYLAAFLRQKGASPFAACLWSIGASPLFAVLFGFTDGMADAFLIVALIALLQDKGWVYLGSMTLAVLTRESYVLFPAFIGLFSFWDSCKTWRTTRRWQDGGATLSISLFHMIPVLSVIFWQIYVALKAYGMKGIETFPFLTASPDLTGLPFVGVVDYLTAGSLRSFSSLFHAERVPVFSISQTIGMAFFLILLLSSLVIGINRFRQAVRERDSRGMGIMAGCLSIVLLYACFGGGMLWAPIGYVKATGFFSILFCLCLDRLSCRKRRMLFAFLALTVLFFDVLMWQTWVPSAG